MSASFDPETGLGPRLRLAREERQWSVRELARRIWCSASLTRQIERGVSVPSVGVSAPWLTRAGQLAGITAVRRGARPRPAEAAGGRPGAVQIRRCRARLRSGIVQRAGGRRHHRAGQRAALGAAHSGAGRDDRLPRGALLPGGPLKRRAPPAAPRRARVRPDHQRHAAGQRGLREATSSARANRSCSTPQRCMSTGTGRMSRCTPSGGDRPAEIRERLRLKVTPGTRRGRGRPGRPSFRCGRQAPGCRRTRRGPSRQQPQFPRLVGGPVQLAARARAGSRRPGRPCTISSGTGAIFAAASAGASGSASSLPG